MIIRGERAPAGDAFIADQRRLAARAGSAPFQIVMPGMITIADMSEQATEKMHVVLNPGEPIRGEL